MSWEEIVSKITNTSNLTEHDTSNTTLQNATLPSEKDSFYYEFVTEEPKILKKKQKQSGEIVDTSVGISEEKLSKMGKIIKKSQLIKTKSPPTTKMQLRTRKISSRRHLPEDEDIIKTGRATAKARLKFLNKMPTQDPSIKRRNEAYKRQQQIYAQEEKNAPKIKILDYKEYMDQNTLCFKSDKPVGLGAFDLRDFVFGEESRSPTLNDIASLNNDDFFPHQTDYEMSLKEFQNLPKEELERVWKTTAPYNVGHHDLTDRSNKIKAATTLASLTNVKRVKYIAWIPEISKEAVGLKYADNTLKGKYVCRYREQQPNKKMITKDVAVSNDWVKKNFNMMVLSYAQRLGYDVATPVVYKDEQGNRYQTEGFVDIESANITMEMEEGEEFNQLQYIPSHVDDKGHTIPEKWMALSNETQRRFEVSYDHLLENYDKPFLETLKQSGVEGNRAFIAIPPGDSKHHKEYPHDLAKSPKQHYWQAENTRTCLTTAFANMLWFCKCNQHAGIVYNMFPICTDPKALTIFKTNLLKLSTLLKCTNVNVTTNDIHVRHYNVPILTCVKSDDNKEDHTIVIYQGYIFDGNFSHALPLSIKALDYCCSTSTRECKFVKFVKSSIFQHFGNYIKRFAESIKK